MGLWPRTASPMRQRATGWNTRFPSTQPSSHHVGQSGLELWRSTLGATDSYHWPQCGPQVRQMILVTPSIPSHLRVLSPTQFLFSSAYVIRLLSIFSTATKQLLPKSLRFSWIRWCRNNQFLARASYTEGTWPLQEKTEFSIRLHWFIITHETMVLTNENSWNN